MYSSAALSLALRNATAQARKRWGALVGIKKPGVVGGRCELKDACTEAMEDASNVLFPSTRSCSCIGGQTSGKWTAGSPSTGNAPPPLPADQPRGLQEDETDKPPH